MSSYSELLRDPRWQRKRLEIMQRDRFVCVECGASAKTLNVHHGFYLRGKNPWEYPNQSLRTLCEDCHESIEREMADLRQFIGGFSWGMLRLLSSALVSGLLVDLTHLRDCPTRICAICGAHRGMDAGRFLCGSCRYDPFTDDDVLA